MLGADAAGDALVVVHTPPGEANRVGAALDRLAWSGIVGTIAGDDTIFIAVRDRPAQRRLLAALTEVSGER
jgi:transcriptional regulator of arginine metabolism